MGNIFHLNRQQRRKIMATGNPEDACTVAMAGIARHVQQPYRKKTDKKSIPQFFNAETTLATISNDSPDEDAASANSDAIRKSEETKEMTEIKSEETSSMSQNLTEEIQKEDAPKDKNEELIRLLTPFIGIDCQNPIWDDEHLPSNICWHIAEIRKGKLSERNWIITFRNIIETYQPAFVWSGVEIPEISKLDGQRIDSDIIEKIETLLKNISDQKSALETLYLNQPTTAAEWAQLSENLAKAGNQDDVDELRKAVEALPLKGPDAPELQNAEQKRIRELEEALEKAKEEHNKDIEQKEARIKELEKEKVGMEKTYNEVEELHSQEIAKKEARIQELTKEKYKSKPPIPRNSLSEDDMVILRNYFSGGKKGLLLTSLTQALNILRILYSDRVEIVSEAWESAGESNFRDPTKAFFMMERLITKFLDIMRDGKGMGFAKTECFFDKEFASDEHDKVPDLLRTFSDRVMREHLKIGNNEGAEKGWRCHFCYDPISRKIVIGHCGKHLNFK